MLGVEAVSSERVRAANECWKRTGTNAGILWPVVSIRHKLPAADIACITTFISDTLFISGCGRFFEGTAEEMHKALNVTLSALPSDTVVFCGHEYTASNVAFSSHILPSRPAVTELLQAVKTRKNGGVTTGVYTIGQEKEHNVFMLVSDKEVMEKVGGKDEVDTMQKLREAKNNFKANI